MGRHGPALSLLLIRPGSVVLRMLNLFGQRLHLREYACEALGTWFNLFVGLNIIFFDFSPGLWPQRHIPSQSLRLLITGVVYAGSGSLFAISPPGKVSGAHINPSVTLAMWMRKKMSTLDAVGYVLAQFIGAIIASAILLPLWGSHAGACGFGVTMPGDGYGVLGAASAEVLMTAALVLALFGFLSSRALMRWTPVMVWLLVAFEVWRGAPISGTSLNPARSFGPALLSWHWHDQWMYLLAPPLGAVVGVLLFRMAAAERQLLTGKLFHAFHYPSLFRDPHVPQRPA